eukprot:TRINITY_DN7409_c0_g1_i1.p1 TRINITY_DN7409_c0_g1~~TRINITY_DN7409_c0_g1_i1.p1  ORF type:complete len:126 (-),score=54.72 TRINITY_DN7409_c0_g1_i1:31-408(-)
MSFAFEAEVRKMRNAKTVPAKMKHLITIVLVMLEDGDPFFLHDNEAYDDFLPDTFEDLFSEMTTLLAKPAKQLKMSDEELLKFKMRIAELGISFKEGDSDDVYPSAHEEWPMFGFEEGWDFDALK